VDGHECLTVPEAGLASKTNGELLRLAERAFDVLIRSIRASRSSKI
jgi:hypothetical protein